MAAKEVEHASLSFNHEGEGLSDTINELNDVRRKKISNLRLQIDKARVRALSFLLHVLKIGDERLVE
jgi:hypothetical protein